MKKILSLLAVLFVLFGSVVPVAAKGKQSEVLVNVSAPSSALAGTSFNIFLTANKLGRSFGGEQKLLLSFPASVVKSATCWGNDRYKDGKNVLSYEWKFKLSFRHPMSQLKCTVTLRAGLSIGQNQYLSLFDKKADMKIGNYFILVAKPELKWSTSSPESVSIGEVPFDVVISAKNDTKYDIAVDMNVYIYFNGGATNRNITYEVPVNGLIDFAADGYGATMRWTGIVKAMQASKFVIHLASAKAGWALPGTYPLFRMYDSAGAYSSATKMITLK